MFEINNYTYMEKKLTWGLAYFENVFVTNDILHNNIGAANCDKSPHLESHDVLKKMKEFESHP